MTHSKQGPKRRRSTPRDKTAVSRQGFTEGTPNFARERRARLAAINDAEQWGEVLDHLNGVSVADLKAGRY